MMPSNKTIIIICLMIVLGLIGYLAMQPQKMATAKIEVPQLTVTVIHPQQTTLNNQLHLNGTIVPKEDFAVTADSSVNQLQQILVEAGQWVKKGDVLATFETANATNQLAAMQTQLNDAEKIYLNAEKIKDTGAISPALIAEKKAAYEALKAQRDDANFKVGKAKLTAPVAGLVYERQAQLGNNNEGNPTLFKIAKNGEVELEVALSESDFTKIQINVPVEVSLANQETTIPGKIRFVAAALDSNTHMRKIRIALPKNKQVPIGSYAAVLIGATTNDGLAIPQHAIEQDNDQSYIWLVNDDGTVRHLPINQQLAANGRTLITGEGLTADSKIVANAGAFLNEGDAVTMVDGQQP